jgi:hypothetical protein
MSYITPKYPVLESLSVIPQHDPLPTGVNYLGHCLDNTSGRDKLFTLTNHRNHLSLLVSYHAGPNDQYFCKQYDFPLKALSWFPKALEEIRKPPAEGGLHAGAMISKDVDVDGEMLAVGSTTSGYCLINRSRNDHRNDHHRPEEHYAPIEISLSYNFLYRLGFLDLWKSLGEKYERGEL